MPTLNDTQVSAIITDLFAAATGDENTPIETAVQLHLNHIEEHAETIFQDASRRLAQEHNRVDPLAEKKQEVLEDSARQARDSFSGYVQMFEKFAASRDRLAQTIAKEIEDFAPGKLNITRQQVAQIIEAHLDKA